MVYESRVGDVFALGATSWRIEDITHDRVLVSPAPGQPGRLPFWKGDQLGRPAELGARDRGVHPRAVRDDHRAGHRALPRRGARRVGGGQPGLVPRGAARGHHHPALGPHDPGRAVPRRARRLADRDPLAVRRPGARPVGAGDRGAAARALRHRRPGDAGRRRHRAAGSRRPTRTRRAPTWSSSTPTRSRTSSPPRWAARRCSRPGSASARRGRCCCPAATPAAARRCGSSGSAVPSCSRSPSSTRPSRSSSRRSASASRTSTTCRPCSA